MNKHTGPDRLPVSHDARSVNGAGAAREEPSLLAFMSLLLGHARLVFGLPLLALVAGVSLTILAGVEYAAVSKFMPESSGSSANRLAGIAMQFGLQIDGGSQSHSPEFYAALVRSRELLRETVQTRYRVPAEGGGVREATLVQLLAVEGESEGDRLEGAVERLARKVTAAPELKTGLVSLEVRSFSPELALQINNRLLELVNAFNLQKRQSTAAAERSFIEGRFNLAQEDLRNAEAELERFLDQNRRYQNSPTLMFEADRLQRMVALRQQVFTSLAQAYEQARIDEVRNTPVITVMESPAVEDRRWGRGPVMNGIMAALIAGLFAVGIAFGREYVARREEEDPDGFQELRRRARSAFTDIVPIRGIRQRRPRDPAPR